MAIKVLGQYAPAAITESDLYVAGSAAVSGNLIVCNRSNVGAFYRVSVSVGGGATATKDYLIYDSLLPGNESLSLLSGLTLSTGDKVRIYADVATTSFSLMGEEISGTYTKVLGQSAPGATTPTDLYTVPASKFTVSSSLFVCNRSNASATFRVSVAVGGGATGDKDYLFYDTALGAYETMTAMMGLTLATTDVVRVYASSASLSFNLMGEERPI
jgi:hypothetical protein